MAHFVIPLPHQSFEFEGKMIVPAEVTSNRLADSGRLRPRWVQMSLFRTKGHTYVLVREACSVVVHEENAPCVPAGKADERGKVVEVSELPPDAVPCARAELRGRRCCHPDLAGSAPVRLEQTATTVFRSPEPAEVIKWMSEASHRDGGVSDRQSRPMKALLDAAARKDSAFRVHPVVRIA